MPLNKRPYRGTRDLFPSDKRIQDFIFSKMKRVAESFGYEPYDGPLLEEVELYKAKSGEELINEQIYSFKDRGERHVAIRPEMTPTLARMVANIHREALKPIRWYAISNLMRYEKPQRGRLREHWQFNCDIFGAPKGHGEVEILQIVLAIFKQFEATDKHFEILLNNRLIVDTIFKKILGVSSEQAQHLYKTLDKAKKVSSATFQEMTSLLKMERNSLKKLFQYRELKNFEELKNYLQQNGQEEIIKDLDNFRDLLVKTGLAPYVKFDPTIVRGLDYYTGIVFEVFDKHPQNKRALCGGGAYDNLLQIFNEPSLNGVGLGLGDITFKDFLDIHQLLPPLDQSTIQVLATYQEEGGLEKMMEIASQLRQQKLQVLFQFESIKLKKAFSIASKRSIKYVLLMGQRELDEKKLQIKNVQTRQQKDFSWDQIEDIVNFISDKNLKEVTNSE